MWANPVSNVLGGWTFYNEGGLVGGEIYYIGYQVKHKESNKNITAPQNNECKRGQGDEYKK